MGTVIYADIFDYPLSLPEIHRYLTSQAAALETLQAEIEEMPLTRSVNRFYTLPGREQIVAIRERREKQAAALWKNARRYGRIIAMLPFVRMLAVTGSLAMNNVEPDADIDYLIVTAPGHLWKCRLLTLAVARLAALQNISLCPNYLISQDALEISPQSLYTAHEFAQMIPLYGLDIYEQLRAANPWVLDYLPNARGLPQASQPVPARVNPSRLAEWLLSTPPGQWLERWEMERKIRKLSSQNSGNNEAVFNARQCKGHSNRHGQRTMRSLAERLSRLAPGLAK